MSPKFVHLKVHTEYSLTNGLVRIDDLVGKLVAQEAPAVCVTDQSNLCALIKLYKAVRGKGIKLVIGVDIWLDNPDDANSPYRLTLLAMNDLGYRNMAELVSRSFQEGQHNGRAIVRQDWLVQASSGLLALSGAKEGEIGRLLLSGKVDQAQKRLQHWTTVFPNAFYLELQRTRRLGDEEHVQAAVTLAAACQCPVVATNDVQFLERGDFDAHEARICISDSEVLDNPKRERRYSEEQYLKSDAEMCELFADLPEALENTLEIAKRCSVELRLGQYFLPNYPVPEGMTMDEFFRKVCREGLDDRLKVIFAYEEGLPGAALKPKNTRQEYLDRLTFELDIILQMGFPGYFLIVMDFIQWAKNHGIPVGPGRGSGAGSLVAYSLKITDLDPLAYDLLFERFLNPERSSTAVCWMPTRPGTPNATWPTASAQHGKRWTKVRPEHGANATGSP